MTGEGFRALVTTFAGNIFLAFMGLGAIVFLFKREMTQFVQFAVVALLVASFIYTPDFWVGASKAVAQALGR